MPRTPQIRSAQCFGAYKILEGNADYVYHLRRDGNTDPIPIQQMLGNLFDAAVELKRRVQLLEGEVDDA